MSNNNLVREQVQKGAIFSLIIIFIVLIGFHVVAADLLSKLLGVQVQRGAIAGTVYMVYTHILLASIFGWNASDKNSLAKLRIFQSLVTSITIATIVGGFSLLLNHLVQSKTDVREYLTALSFDAMDFFLLNRGLVGVLIIFSIYLCIGLLASLFAIGFQSTRVQEKVADIKNSLPIVVNRLMNKCPPLIKKYGKYGLFIILVILGLILPLTWGSYLNYVTGLVGLYIIAGIGLNIIVGLSGQLMLGYAAFIAIGAYSMALLNAPKPHGILLGFWPSLLIGIVLSIVAAILLGLPTLGLRGDYLAIVTLGFGEIIRILLKSDLLMSLTGGPGGIHAIQGPTLFGKPFTSDSDYVYLIFLLLILTIVIYQRLANSSTGRAMLAINEDPIAAQASGINLRKYKLLALIIGAGFAGLVGGVMAARNAFTGPNDHTLNVSINVLSLLIVGGINSVPGIALGAFALKGIPEILREVEIYRQLIFGVLLIVMMLLRPEGLWPATRPNLKTSEPLLAIKEPTTIDLSEKIT